MCKRNWEHYLVKHLKCIVFMSLPSQTAKFAARKNENNFIQVSEAYNYTLICSLATNLLPASENTLHDVTVLRIHSAIFWSDALRMKHFQL